MGMRWGLTNRRTQRIVFALILVCVFLAAIIIFALLRQRTGNVDVNVEGAASPSPAAVVATTTPAATPTLPSTPTPPPTVASTPTPPPTPTAPPPSPPPTAAAPSVTPPPPPAAAPPAPKVTPPSPLPLPTSPAAPPVTPAAPLAPPPLPTATGGAKPPGPAATPPPPPTVPAPAPAPATQPAAPKPAAVAPAPKGPPAGDAQTSVNIAAGQGAELRCPDSRVLLTVRPGSIERPLTLTCQSVPPDSVPPPPGPRVGEIVVALAAEGGLAELPAEVNLGVRYRDEDVSGLNEQQLVIGVLTNGQWQPAPKPATDPGDNFVSATITRLGTYTVYQRP